MPLNKDRGKLQIYWTNTKERRHNNKDLKKNAVSSSLLEPWNCPSVTSPLPKIGTRPTLWEAAHSATFTFLAPFFFTFHHGIYKETGFLLCSILYNGTIFLFIINYHFFMVFIKDLQKAWSFSLICNLRMDSFILSFVSFVFFLPRFQSNFHI